MHGPRDIEGGLGAESWAKARVALARARDELAALAAESDDHQLVAVALAVAEIACTVEAPAR